MRSRLAFGPDKENKCGDTPKAGKPTYQRCLRQFDQASLLGFARIVSGKRALELTETQVRRKNASSSAFLTGGNTSLSKNQGGTWSLSETNLLSGTRKGRDTVRTVAGKSWVLVPSVSGLLRVKMHRFREARSGSSQGERHVVCCMRFSKRKFRNRGSTSR